MGDVGEHRPEVIDGEHRSSELVEGEPSRMSLGVEDRWVVVAALNATTDEGDDPDPREARSNGGSRSVEANRCSGKGAMSTWSPLLSWTPRVPSIVFTPWRWCAAAGEGAAGSSCRRSVAGPSPSIYVVAGERRHQKMCFIQPCTR